MPGYAIAASALRRFGEGGTQGRPVPLHIIDRDQPSFFTTSRAGAGFSSDASRRGHLSRGHAVNQRSRESIQEGTLDDTVGPRPLHAHAAKRVWPVENNARQRRSARGLQRQPIVAR